MKICRFLKCDRVNPVLKQQTRNSILKMGTFNMTRCCFYTDCGPFIIVYIYTWKEKNATFSCGQKKTNKLRTEYQKPDKRFFLILSLTLYVFICSTCSTCTLCGFLIFYLLRTQTIRLQKIPQFYQSVTTVSWLFDAFDMIP